MPRVVYIDDEPRLLEITKDFLEISGEINVDTEESAVTALGRIPQNSYDVIVSDYQMPEMDGIELLKAIRRTGDKTPFILFTGRGREEVAIEALNCGADFYLQKGGDPKVQFRELKNAIFQLSQRKNAEALVAHGERKYRDLVEGANSIILKVDPNGNTVFLNQFGMRFFGVGPDAIGRPVIGSLIRPQDYPEYSVAEHFTEFLTGGRSGDSYTFPVLKGGKEAWVSWTVRTVLDARDRAMEFLVIGNDVTALKKAEMGLQHSTAVLRATLDSSDEGILVVSNDGNISEHNLRFLDLWKVPTSIIEVRSDRRLIDHAGRQMKEQGAFLRFMGECQARPDLDHDQVLELRDGRVIEVHSTPERIGNRVAGRFFSFKDITRQKQYETGLVQQRENIRSLFINNPANMLLIDPDTSLIVHANDAACRFYGYAEEAISKMRLSDISTLPSEEFWNRMRSASDNQKNYFIAPHRLASGEIKDVEIFLAPINYKQRVRLFGIVQDISGTKSVSRLLEESELRHNRILDCISDGIVAIDANDRIVYANARASEVLRLPLDQIIGRDPREFVSPASSTVYSSNLDKRRSGEKGSADYKMRRGDGTEFWTSVSANPIMADGVFEGTIYALNDITERKEAELALQESEERFRYLIEKAPHAIVIVRDSRSIYVNTRCVTMLGYESPEELLGRPVRELFDDSQHELIAASIVPGELETEPSPEHELTVLSRAGNAVPVNLSATRVNLSDGPAVVLVMTDLSLKKKIEEAYRENEHFLERVMSTDPTGIIVYDLPSRRIVYVNERTMKVTGKTLEQIGADDAMVSMVHPDDYSIIERDLMRIVQGGNNDVQESEVRIRDPMNQCRWVHFYSTAFMRDSNGRVLQTISSMRDVSDRKKAEDELKKVNQKLGLLGEITRHDIRNQATIILGNLALSKCQGCTPERLETVERSARMISSHIEFASDYQKLGTTAPQWQNVARTVEGLDICRGIDHLVISEQARRLSILADPMLRKVFHNLLEDSVRYGRTPADVSIDCQPAGGGLLLSYEDIGPGILDEEKDKIFEKGYGKGTGLGLFLSREVLAITGIKIKECGTFGQGVRFEMEIPAGQFQFL